MLDNQRLVTVATFNTLVEAEMAQAFLDGEGIRSFVADGEIANMNWFLSTAIGGIKLQVAESDLLAAERLMHSRTGHAGRLGLDDYGFAKSTDAITTTPGRVREEAAEQPEGAEHEGKREDNDENAAEAMVRTAWRAALLGLVLLPPLLHVYSLYLLGVAGSRKEPLSERFQKLFMLVMVFDVGMVLGPLAFVAVLVVSLSSR